MYRYFVHFTCRTGGQPDTGYVPLERPSPIPSLAHAQEHGLAHHVQRLLRDQGLEVTEVVLTEIKVA
jgi:hypothetical protein